MDGLQSTMLGTSRVSQTSSVPPDLPGGRGWWTEMVLILTALVANGDGKHPTGPGRSLAVITSRVSAPAAGAGCWSSFASQL